MLGKVCRIITRFLKDCVTLAWALLDLCGLILRESWRSLLRFVGAVIFVFAVVEYARRGGSAVVSALAAAVAALAALLVWRVMEKQSNLFRKQTELLDRQLEAVRPGCRISLLDRELFPEVFRASPFNQSEHSYQLISLVPKPGSDVFIVGLVLQLLDESDQILHQTYVVAHSFEWAERGSVKPEGPIRPGKHLKQEGCIARARTSYAHLASLARGSGSLEVARWEKRRFAVHSNYGIDTSESFEPGVHPTFGEQKIIEEGFLWELDQEEDMPSSHQ